GDHPRQHELGGEPALADDAAEQDDHDGDVVEHQPEEGVDVASPRPAVAMRHRSFLRTTGAIPAQTTAAGGGVQRSRNDSPLPLYSRGEGSGVRGAFSPKSKTPSPPTPPPSTRGEGRNTSTRLTRSSPITVPDVHLLELQPLQQPAGRRIVGVGHG